MIGKIARSVAVAALLVPGVAPLAAPGQQLPCRWEAKPYVQVLDGTRLPDLGAHAVFSGAPPATQPVADPYRWNPPFPIDAQGRVHARSDGRVSSILTVSGGGCAETHVAVLVYSDGFVPRRGAAFDYQPFGTTLSLHAESEAPLRLRSMLVSADVRSIEAAGYRERDESGEVRAGYALARGGPTIEIAYLDALGNGVHPNVRGAGAAVEIPPALDQTLSASGSLSYYPSVVGGATTYRILRYRLAGTFSLEELFGNPLYFEVASLADHRTATTHVPSVSYQSLTLGIGYRFGVGIP